MRAPSSSPTVMSRWPIIAAAGSRVTPGAAANLLLWCRLHRYMGAADGQESAQEIRGETRQEIQNREKEESGQARQQAQDQARTQAKDHRRAAVERLSHRAPHP